MSHLKPFSIVSELDKYVVGQNKAKRAVAIAIRNRWRRQQLATEIREEIYPKNIIMIGPTGVGKTEISRRLAKLIDAPFIKVEATKYTEVGYVGKDVESMVRDLVEISVKMVKGQATQKVSQKAKDLAEQRLVDILMRRGGISLKEGEGEFIVERDQILDLLRKGKLNQRMVEIEVPQRVVPSVEIFAPGGLGGELDEQFRDMLQAVMPKEVKGKKMTVKAALELVEAQEADKLIDMDQVIAEGVSRAENSGIIFVDEIDKIAVKGGARGGPDVSREGVQRDILPIVEGTSVATKYGVVKSDHILFIAAGAFHMSKPSDLIPELQGRFPIRVELEPLTKEDFVRILKEPKNALTRQYEALLSADGCQLEFTQKGIEEIARIAFEVNERTENIGARRLSTVMEYLLDELSFKAPDLPDGYREVVDHAYVRERLKGVIASEDLTRYIL